MTHDVMQVDKKEGIKSHHKSTLENVIHERERSKTRNLILTICSIYYVYAKKNIFIII